MVNLLPKTFSKMGCWQWLGTKRQWYLTVHDHDRSWPIHCQRTVIPDLPGDDWLWKGNELDMVCSWPNHCHQVATKWPWSIMIKLLSVNWPRFDHDHFHCRSWSRTSLPRFMVTMKWHDRIMIGNVSWSSSTRGEVYSIGNFTNRYIPLDRYGPMSVMGQRQSRKTLCLRPLHSSFRQMFSKGF